MKTTIFFFSFLSALFISGCKEPYEPSVVSLNKNYLVVEGFINPEGTTTIRLSRTTNLTDGLQLKAEAGAIVTVEGEDNSSYNLNENGTGNGTYSQNLSLDNGTKYRLRIKTQNGGEYLSDYAEIKETPEIDSVSWKRESDGVQIYVNTHNPSDNTKYYQWKYNETWEIHSPYLTYFEYRDGAVIPRDNYMDYYQCWGSNTLTSITIGSSEKLSKDIISLQPLTFIPETSEKLSVKYSILVKQYALSKGAYQYFQQMKRNSEQLGGVFDPQPSELKGNIHNVADPAEPVIGYMYAATETQQRIYINASQVSGWNFGMYCTQIIVPTDSLEFYFGNGSMLPTTNNQAGYGGVIRDCADCTTRGSNIRPDFWPSN